MRDFIRKNSVNKVRKSSAMSSVQLTTNQFCENQGLGGLGKYPRTGDEM